MKLGLCLIVLLTGVVVQVGWLLDIPIILTVMENCVSMKPSTAMSFILASFIAIIINSDYRRHTIELASFVFALSLQITGMLLAQVTGLTTGINLIPVGHDTSMYTVHPHLPSVGTMIAFIFITTMGISFLLKKPSYFAARALLVIGLVALTGYVCEIPLLYYYVPELSTGMAIHTAMGFVLLSVAIWRPQHEKAVLQEKTSHTSDYNRGL